MLWGEDQTTLTFMHTTQTDQPVCPVPATFPTLHLLYSGRAGVVGRARALRIGVMPIGRDLTEDEGIALPDDHRASRRHARVELTEARGTEGQQHAVRVLDEDSKNGTFVNGVRISSVVLRDGDVLRIGNSLLLLRHEPSRRLDAEAPALVGRAPALRRVRHELMQVASSLTAVLLFGEPGVGKELAARTLHQYSGRRGELVAVNCAAIPEHLAESLLFGHERGAFSGANTSHEGFFRVAQGGTLFLDEVGELPLSLQPKLLRALQEREVMPVGRTRPVPVDVRIVAATNRDLPQVVQDGGFRADLYARLSGAVIELPPLRARREDILPLLMRSLGTDQTSPAPLLTARLAEALVLYHWPNNVRELLQVADALQPYLKEGLELDLPPVADRLKPDEQLSQPATSEEIRTQHSGLPIPEPLAKPTKPTLTTENTTEPMGPRLSREALERLGRETNWNISQLARLVGRSRRQVRRWMEEYGIHRKER